MLKKTGSRPSMNMKGSALSETPINFHKQINTTPKQGGLGGTNTTEKMNWGKVPKDRKG